MQNINRRDANRIAKQIFIDYGTTFWAFHESALAAHGIEPDTKQAELVDDYFERTVRRVSDWLNV
jgi:hypothetical protein